MTTLRKRRKKPLFIRTRVEEPTPSVGILIHYWTTVNTDNQVLWKSWDKPQHPSAIGTELRISWQTFTVLTL